MTRPRNAGQRRGLLAALTLLLVARTALAQGEEPGSRARWPFP
jgi:hypothetical protein